ncbi:MAG: hypothetical protein OK474_03340 [Thaumarchaeota archaeon]|nr:hypothetical protein [Nitrososphaerota archaeon]
MSLHVQTALATGIPGQETGFIVWSPYSGVTALLLALFLFAVGAAVILLGRHLRRDLRLPRPWRWLKVVIVVVWILQILILLRVFKNIITMDPSAGVTGPVLPVTLVSAACTSALVAYFLRRDGASPALGGAFVAAVAGPMVFEFPFVPIVAPVASTPTDPGAALTIPFFLTMITTLALLSFSPRAAITRCSLYFLGGMFLVFAVWALFGFAYPSDPIPFLRNSASKVLGFATTAAMFRRGKSRTDGSALIDAGMAQNIGA